MSAAEALDAARAAGIRVGVDGDDLVLEAFAAPRPAVLDVLSRNKADRGASPAASFGFLLVVVMKGRSCYLAGSRRARPFFHASAGAASTSRMVAKVECDQVPR
jgi:hypothetical protein